MWRLDCLSTETDCLPKAALNGYAGFQYRGLGKARVLAGGARVMDIQEKTHAQALAYPSISCPLQPLAFGDAKEHADHGRDREMQDDGTPSPGRLLKWLRKSGREIHVRGVGGTVKAVHGAAWAGDAKTTRYVLGR